MQSAGAALVERIERRDPFEGLSRTLPPLLYGSDHAYGIPFTGTGTETAIKSLDAADLQRFHDTWLRPDNLRILAQYSTRMAAGAKIGNCVGRIPRSVASIGLLIANERFEGRSASVGSALKAAFGPAAASCKACHDNFRKD